LVLIDNTGRHYLREELKTTENILAYWSNEQNIESNILLSTIEMRDEDEHVRLKVRMRMRKICSSIHCHCYHLHLSIINVWQLTML
jgi:hypothetical protein